MKIKVLGLTILTSCGRIDYDSPNGHLDATVCDEITDPLLCESFEGDPMLPTIEFELPSFVVADSIHPYRGQRSQHARTTRGLEPAWQLGNVLGGVASGDLYARWYLYVPSGSASVMLTNLMLITATEPFEGVLFNLVDGAASIQCSEPSAEHTSSILVPRDRWICAQLHVAVSEAAGVAETWIEGAPAARLDGLDTLPAGGYFDVHAGLFATSDTVQDLDVWTDELIVTTTSLPPCD